MAPFKNTSYGGAQSTKVNEIEFTPTTSDNTSGLSVTTSGQKVFVPGNGYVYHIFVGPGTFIVNRSGNADILLVGGGAGGGKGSPSYLRGGGGGAGGFREEPNVFLTEQVYEITIGSGGSGTSTYGADGLSGGTTSFTRQPSPTGGVPFTVGGSVATTISVGGGGAGGGSSTGIPSPQGSGGGGEGGNAPGYFGWSGGTGGTYGNNGGRGSEPSNYSGGGGGGAGGNGGSASGGTGGAGGVGKSAFSGDVGIPPFFGTPGPSPGRWFAGGGAGGASGSSVGGAGGGSGTNSPANTHNTGGGGGGSSPGGSSGNGSPGIVIIRYTV